MRLVFAGTPEFAVPALRVAASTGDLVGVYTQPDRPAGRGRQLAPSPVKSMDDQVTIKSAESRLLVERGKIARVASAKRAEATSTTSAS